MFKTVLGSMVKMVKRPNFDDRRAISLAYRQICEGSRALADTRLDLFQSETLKNFMRVSSPGKPIGSLALESRLSLQFCDELKHIQKVARRSMKKPVIRSKEISLAGILKMRVEGATWRDVWLKGGSEAQKKKIRIFLKLASQGTGLEEIAEKLKITENEVNSMKRILKENEKLKITA
jgi:hypothetical protein